ncbi:MAG: GntR family transcriptional regulator [Deltaproteobacteria bacterium]|nr:GntR family transcriptional regulator [Deltaproteobacteria bacterium]
MIQIDLDSSTPLTDQIVSELRLAIASGSLGAGDELPPVRQLAGDLGVNFNTVARAYRALEASGLVSSQRGRGSRVVALVEPSSLHNPKNIVHRLRGALVDARLGGWTQDQLLSMVQVELQSLWPSTSKEI